MLGHSTRRDYCIAVAIGFFASVFVAPAFIAWRFPNAQADSPMIGAVYWMFSVVAMFFLPPFLKFVAKAAADPIGWWRGLKRD